jgi:hypothetical protein
MPSSEMLRRLALVRTDVSEERSSSETSVLTRAKRHSIPEGGILPSHRRENLKSYMSGQLHSPAALSPVPAHARSWAEHAMVPVGYGVLKKIDMQRIVSDVTRCELKQVY